MNNEFLIVIKDFIDKSSKHDAQIRNHPSCNNIFDFSDKYTEEKKILNTIKINEFSTNTEKGDALENLVKLLFSRIELINSFDVTNKDTALGQIDINLIAVDNSLYGVWGMVNDYPSNLIGECKNYSSEKVSRPEIEKTCWRSAKGKALSFFIGNGYKETAISEIGEFNLYKNQIINNGNGVYIVPISISMLEVVIDNNLNFCYFIKWAIKASKMMAIANYL